MKKTYLSVLKPVLSFSIALVLILNFLAVSAKSITHAATYTSNNITYTYSISNNEVTITNVTVGASGSNLTVTIPNQIANCNVTRIGDRAFSTGSSKIGTLILPLFLQYVEDQAFRLCSAMTSVYVSRSLRGISGSAFGSTTQVSSLYLILSSTGNALPINTVQTIQTLCLSKSIKSNGQLDQFVTCDSNGTIVRNSMFELIDSLSYSPLMENIYASYASQIISEIIPSGIAMNDLQKMHIIYNYVVTNTRYSKLFSGEREQPLDNTYVTALGPLLLGTGTCGGLTSAIKFLGDAAGLNVKKINLYSHMVNVFRPSGSSKYYYIDASAATFCKGWSQQETDSMLYTDTIVAMDGVSCPIAETYYGSSIYIRVENKSNLDLDIKLLDVSEQKTFASFNTNQNINENLPFSITKLASKGTDKIFAYSHIYYTLKINQGSTNLVTDDYVLNSYNTKTFVDNNGNTHTYKVEIISDPTYQFTENGEYFKLTIN